MVRDDAEGSPPVNGVENDVLRRNVPALAAIGVGLSLCAAGGPVDERAEAWLAARLPSFASCTARRLLPAMHQAVIDARAWLAHDAQLLSFDRAVHRAEDLARARRESMSLRIEGDLEELCLATPSVMTRYQRLFPRYNERYPACELEPVLARHAELHDREKPLVRADHDHALDVWQWVLRLCPGASAALQLAGLFHDVERLQSEADVRSEHLASDYATFKQQHAAQGAVLLGTLLSELRLPHSLLARAQQLIAQHERPSEDTELRTLNDADSLSFFALNSAGFLAYYGPDHTRVKVAYTFRRMQPSARAMLSEVRLEARLRRMLDDHAAAEAAR